MTKTGCGSTPQVLFHLNLIDMPPLGNLGRKNPISMREKYSDGKFAYCKMFIFCSPGGGGSGDGFVEGLDPYMGLVSDKKTLNNLAFLFNFFFFKVII